ncbi:hypothetical protein C0993_000410, partial [Termitomyces sp. T159_Od127]
MEDQPLQAPMMKNEEQAPIPTEINVDHDQILAAAMTLFSNIDTLPASVKEEPRTGEEAKK